MLSVVIEAFKKLVMFLCTSFCKLIVWYTATGVLKSPCIAHQADQMGFALCKFTRLGYGIHLITTASVIKRYLSLYEFTLWGQDLVSIVRIRESILKKIYENFVGTLETVRNIQRCLYQRSVRTTVVWQEKEKSICGVFTSSIKCSVTFENSVRLIIIISLNYYCILNMLLKIFCHFFFAI